ncbi:unnamed protein product [Clavelina lepadiformis]|uniref:BD-FAE-like domain-containing protein n=1 Tax=Clavelina lepadiformis TaxID=159417 RepID=A0ABP0F3D8_CLALP
MAIVFTPFGDVKEEDFPSCAHFTKRKPADEILNEFYELGRGKSKIARDTIKCELNISYGESPREIIDVFYPSNVTEDTGMVIFFHGGYWQEGCSQDYHFLAIPITSSGRICILVGKDLAPQASLQESLNQCRKSLSFISKKFWATSEIIIFGHSAGGQECTMLLSTDWKAYDAELAFYLKSKLKKVISICGVYDLTQLIETHVNDVLNMSWKEAISVSPIAHIDQLYANLRSYDCEFIMINVENDAPTILKCSRIFERVNEIRKFGISNNLKVQLHL